MFQMQCLHVAARTRALVVLSIQLPVAIWKLAAAQLEKGFCALCSSWKNVESMHVYSLYTLNNLQSCLTSEALAVPLLTSTERGAEGSTAIPVAEYESLTPWLSAMRTMSPSFISMRATSTPAGNKPPPLFRMSKMYLQNINYLRERMCTRSSKPLY